MTPEQKEVLSKVKDIWINKQNNSYEEDKEWMHELTIFERELKTKGFSLFNYILGNKLVSSSIADSRIASFTTDFDTPDHDIEKFINNL